MGRVNGDIMGVSMGINGACQWGYNGRVNGTCSLLMVARVDARSCGLFGKRATTKQNFKRMKK